jgi:hypothetical protein
MHRSRQIILFGLALALVLVVIVCAVFFDAGGRERARIRVRYEQMTTALSTGDTNAVLGLIAPSFRSSFDELRLSRLDGFAKPLGPQSSILVLGREATVWPIRTSHYVVLPGGHTVEMVRVGSEWFFTGMVHLD